MTDMIQSLKAAVARYPGTMAELARRAAIDRSTLYKILGGQRTPRREQLERLTDALELTEEEKPPCWCSTSSVAAARTPRCALR